MKRNARRVGTALLTVALIAFLSYLAVPVNAPEKSVKASDNAIWAEGDPASPPRVVSDVTGWGERADGSFDFAVGQMTRDGSSRKFFLNVPVEADARIEYLIAYGRDDYRVDPANPLRALGVAGERSELRGRNYQPPAVFVDPPVTPAGTVTEHSVAHQKLGGSRRVFVYTPPGFDLTAAATASDPAATYPLITFHDGALMIEHGEVPRVLDWLIAKQSIRPVIAVFVEPESRANDYRAGAPMQEFVARGLIDWITARYPIARPSKERAIVGVSAGARAAFETAERFSYVYGRAALLIPALDESTFELAANQLSPHNKKVILAARYDALYFAGARRLKASLIARRDHPTFIEVAEGHNTTTWKTHMDRVLTALLSQR
jgi:enterochelin esterase-like enzyme